MAPEVVEGETKQTLQSDIYSFCKILFCIINQGIINSLEASKKEIIITYAERCISVRYTKRLCKQNGRDVFKQLLE